MSYHANDFPPQEGWLTDKRVTYFRNLLEIAFLLFALPYVLGKIITSPFRAAKSIAAAKVGVPA